MPFILVDLDSSLSNDSHRQHLAQRKLWDEYHSLLHLDTPNWYVRLLIYEFKTRILGGQVVLLTGREDRLRDHTLAWLHDQKIWFDVLLMRPDGDYRETTLQFKKAAFDLYVASSMDKDCFLAIEDLPDVVDLWKSYGIPVLQVHQSKCSGISTIGDNLIMNYPQDFGKEPWALRNGRIVGDLVQVRALINGTVQQAWHEGHTGLFWDLDGAHIYTEEWVSGVTERSSLLDIVSKATSAATASAIVSMALDARRSTFVVTGGSSGLGMALSRALMGSRLKSEVFNLDITSPAFAYPSGYHFFRCNVKHSEDVLLVRDKLPKKIDVLINCAGVNHIEWMKKLKIEDWDRVMNTNARGIYLLSQALLPNLKDGGTICNVVSNASHVPMTNSLAYNASKAAAHMMTLQMARELSKSHGITVFGLSPNKMAGTGMSRYIESRVPELRGWTAERAAEYQRASLLCGEETDVDTVAEFMTFLLEKKQRHKYLAGCIIPYGA